MTLKFILQHLWVILSGIILQVYYETLSPSIAGGDSGEIVAEGCILGTAHPPGYPLLTLLIYGIKQIGGYLPMVTSVAYRVNAFSAICTMLAGVCITGIIKNMSKSIFIQTKMSKYDHEGGGYVLGTGLFAFSPLIWQYAVTAEVFPLNTLFSAMIVYLVIEFSRSRRVWVAVLGAFVCGLALCNQHTIILFEVPCVMWMLFLLRNVIYRDNRIFILLSIAFITGLLPYAYLPLAAIYRPQAGGWGHVSTWNGFLHHFLRKDYGTFQLFSGANGRETENFWQRNEAYFTDVSSVQGLGIALYFAGVAMATIVLYSWNLLDGVYRKGYADTEHKPKNAKNASTPNTNNKKDRKKENKKQKKQHQSHTSAALHDDNNDDDNDTDIVASATPTASSSGNPLISEMETHFSPCVLVVTYVFYFVVFHSLANLPLGEKLLFGVHQRFWMQPNVLFFSFCGIGYNIVIVGLEWGMLKMFGQVEHVNANHHDADTEKTTFVERLQSVPRGHIVVLVALVSQLLAGAAVALQCGQWRFISDQSRAYFFQNYARAILEPLPVNAVLLINYDMQWTAVRYMQQCEGLRSDVTAINLSMMTYQWWRHKHQFYPHLTFPGRHLAAQAQPVSSHFPKGVVKDYFTVSEFLDENWEKLGGNIFLGGKLSFIDQKLNDEYELTPVGLLRQFVPKRHMPNATEYNVMMAEFWYKTITPLSELPSVDKYPEETWEWTIGRDLKDRVADSAAHLLEKAIPTLTVDVQPLVDAVYWLENSVMLEHPKVPTSMLKNAGLAHVHLVQSTLVNPAGAMPEPSADLFGSKTRMGWPESNCKEWSALRFMHHWGAFLQRPDAVQDPQYKTIKDMYAAVQASTGKGKGSSPGPGGDNKGGGIQEDDETTSGVGKTTKKRTTKRRVLQQEA